MIDAIETCAQCRFDNSAYSDLEVAGTLRAIVPWWELITRGLDGDVLQQRPAPGVWSAVEYAEHSAEVTRVHATGLAIMFDQDGLDLGSATADAPIAAAPSHTPTADAIAALARELDALRAFEDRVAAEPHRFVLLGGDRYEAGWLIRHTVHDALHHLQDVGRGMHALGVGTPSQQGSVAYVNVSDGGVPKQHIDAVDVGYRGLVGDRQRSRKHHGRVWQALCLYSTDAIATLRADGHPIEAGSAGENFTISGIDWETLRPGTRVRIGTALAELSLPALPCSHNARWFTDGDYDRIHHDRNWALTRWYASVLEDGHVGTGDAVVVE